MALLKNAKKTEQTAKTVSVNFSEALVKEFSKWAGKSLIDIDATQQLKSISVGRKTWEGGEIVNLVIGLANRRIAFPLSKGFSENVDNDNFEESLLDGEFYAANKFDEDKDEDGKYPYSGPMYISFGKPAGLTFDTEDDLVGTQTVAEEEEK